MDDKPAGWFMSARGSSTLAHYFFEGENSAACRNDLVRAQHTIKLCDPVMQDARCERCVLALGVRS